MDTKPTSDSIYAVIVAIMHHDGPDRHIDGSEVITDYIEALLRGEGFQWALTYGNALEASGRLNPIFDPRD